MWKRPTQIVQPHEFWHLGEPGKGEVKATCFWLDGLPPLVPTTPNETGRHPACWLQPPSKDRWKDRSRTYPGIADAMGTQWGELLRAMNWMSVAPPKPLYEPATIGSGDSQT